MNKWIFTFEELLEFKKKNFNDYTLFLKSKLGKRHDNSYICGTCVLPPKEVDLIKVKGNIYEDYLYLITSIDIDSKYIEFNQIGTTEEILQTLSINIKMETKIDGKKLLEILDKVNKE